MISLHKPDISIMRTLSLNFIVFLVLASCTPPSIPIQISDVTTSHPPLVGKTIDRYVELTLKTDESDALVFINFPPPIYSEDQEYRWELRLKEDEPVTLWTEMCVLEAGMWAIDVSISLYSEDGMNMGGDRETIGVTAKADSGEVLLEREIRFDIHKMTEEAHEFDMKIEPSDCKRP